MKYRNKNLLEKHILREKMSRLFENFEFKYIRITSTCWNMEVKQRSSNEEVPE